MSAVRRFLWRWRVSIGVLLAVAAFVGTAGYSIQRNSDTLEQVKAQADALVDERIDSRTGECETSNEFRENFPATLEGIAKASSSTQGLDLTALPEFKDVPDSVQAYLAALTVAIRANPGSGQDIVTQAAQEYRRKFPVQDCAALKRKLERELR